mgnify:CR=1 FL=1
MCRQKTFLFSFIGGSETLTGVLFQPIYADGEVKLPALLFTVHFKMRLCLNVRLLYTYIFACLNNHSDKSCSRQLSVTSILAITQILL